MSKMKDALRAEVAKKFGEAAGKAMDYLFDAGTIDDQQARNHMMMVNLFDQLAHTERIQFHIEQDLSDEYGLSRWRIRQLGSDSAKA